MRDGDVRDLLRRATDAEPAGDFAREAWNAAVRYQRRKRFLVTVVPIVGVTALVFAFVWLDVSLTEDRATEPLDTATASVTPTLPTEGTAALPSNGWTGGEEGTDNIQGFLKTRTTEEGACAWLQRPGFGRETAYMWPEGFAVDVETGNLVDGDGIPVAAPGDYLYLRSTMGALPTDQRTPCQRGYIVPSVKGDFEPGLPWGAEEKTPIIDTCGTTPTEKPDGLALACGDAGLQLQGIQYDQYAASRVTGSARIWVNPSFTDVARNSYPVRFTFDRVRERHALLLYTRLRLTFPEGNPQRVDAEYQIPMYGPLT